MIDAVAGLLQEIGIPRTLKELGLPEDKQDWTAESAIGAARLVNNNPRKLDLDAMKAITRAAFSGDRADAWRSEGDDDEIRQQFRLDRSSVRALLPRARAPFPPIC